MQRKDFYLCGILLLVAVVIFYPVLYTDYVYTDDVVQLWNFKFGVDFKMYGGQGRWIPEWLLSGLYAAIDTVHEVNYIRTLSLIIWLVCIPVWYVVIKRLAAKLPAYEYLPFFTCLYLITSLPFAVSVQWATCMELSVGNTAGLLSGAVLYFGIRDKERFSVVPLTAALGAGVLAQLSLFTYQSCFGCFLLPFLFHYVSRYTVKKDIVLAKGLAFYLLMYAIWYGLFKLSLVLGHVTSDPRTGLYLNIPRKLAFFFAQPLRRAFWFNVVVNNNNKPATAVYLALLAGWMGLAFMRFRDQPKRQAFQYMACVLVVFGFSYLPSLVVRENYSSNRTLLAIDMCVWIVCAETLFLLQHITVRKIAGITIACVLVLLGFYNFRRQFLQPVHEEYVAVKKFIQQQYTENIKTVYFIKAAGDAFQKKYHIQSSMDEFGVPSTFADWVPEDLVRQLVLEKTGSSQKAQALVITYWPDMESFVASGQVLTGNSMLVNVPAIIK
jgi:hypothetical protein